MELGAPFGGFKASGLGRELEPEGLAAYLQPKAINLPPGYEIGAVCFRDDSLARDSPCPPPGKTWIRPERV
jgi:hypothetical protein